MWKFTKLIVIMKLFVQLSPRFHLTAMEKSVTSGLEMKQVNVYVTSICSSSFSLSKKLTNVLFQATNTVAIAYKMKSKPSTTTNLFKGYIL